jgi:hypothetical protein
MMAAQPWSDALLKTIHIPMIARTDMMKLMIFPTLLNAADPWL